MLVEAGRIFASFCACSLAVRSASIRSCSLLVLALESRRIDANAASRITISWGGTHVYVNNRALVAIRRATYRGRMNGHMTAAVATILCAAFTATACTSGASNNATSDGGAPSNASSASPDGSGASSALTCVGVLKCAAVCPDADVDACVQDCVGRTAGSSHDVTEGLLLCMNDNACGDADCVNAKCADELNACLSDVPAEGSPTTEPPPTGETPSGSVPSNLVGTWSSVGTSTGSVWTFDADGATVTAFEIDTSIGSCTYKTSVTSSGVTAATKDTFVYHRSSGTQVLKKCGSSSSSALGAADLTYQYTLGTYDDGDAKLTIHFVSEDGTVEPSGIELHR